MVMETVMKTGTIDHLYCQLCRQSLRRRYKEGWRKVAKRVLAGMELTESEQEVKTVCLRGEDTLCSVVGREASPYNVLCHSIYPHVYACI